MRNAILLTLEEGGLTLWALLGLAVMIYSLVFTIWWRCLEVRKKVQSESWMTNDDTLTESRLRCDELADLNAKFAFFELNEISWMERRLPFLAILIGAAPLLGLLGTVAGMLITFSGMATATRQSPIDTISAGISKALVTTQAGLVIAVPAAFLLALLKSLTDSTSLELQRQLHCQLGRAIR